jgi:LysR family transcriptional regulator, regulator for bpeEF and oprC
VCNAQLQFTLGLGPRAQNRKSSSGGTDVTQLGRADALAGLWPFVLAAQSRSLTVAARALRITPSAVSKSIGKLEKELGVRLLERSPRNVTLTAEGLPFFHACEAALAAIDVAKQATSVANNSPSGLLRVSIPVALGERVIAPALGELLSTYPSLSIESTFTDSYVDLEREGFDLVVRLGRRPVSALRVHALPKVRWVTVASPAYLSRLGAPKSPSQLSEHNCLRFLLSRGLPQPWLFGQARAGQGLQVTGNYVSNHAATLIQFALAGAGLLQAHEYAVTDHLREGQLVEVLKEYEPPPLSLNILFPQSRMKLARVRVFIDAMDTLFAGPS